MMVVTFVSPSSSKSHTYGPYVMPVVPKKGDRVEFENVSDGHVSFNVGTASYKFAGLLSPVVVKVSIFGPLGSNPYVGM